METNFIPSFTQLDALRDLGRQKGTAQHGEYARGDPRS